jgi:hypothetical protein
MAYDGLFQLIFVLVDKFEIDVVELRERVGLFLRLGVETGLVPLPVELPPGLVEVLSDFDDGFFGHDNSVELEEVYRV